MKRTQLTPISRKEFYSEVGEITEVKKDRSLITLVTKKGTVQVYKEWVMGVHQGRQADGTFESDPNVRPGDILVIK
jgi:hypothetical protein